MAGLKNQAVVVDGRLCKCLEVRQGMAVVVFIDHRDRLVVREVPASSVIKFADASRPRSFWPEANVAFDEGDEGESKARKNRRRTARGA